MFSLWRYQVPAEGRLQKALVSFFLFFFFFESRNWWRRESKKVRLKRRLIWRGGPAESGNISAGRPGRRARTRVRLHLNLRGEITVGLCFSGFRIKHTRAPDLRWHHSGYSGADTRFASEYLLKFWTLHSHYLTLEADILSKPADWPEWPRMAHLGWREFQRDRDERLLGQPGWENGQEGAIFSAHF